MSDTADKSKPLPDRWCFPVDSTAELTRRLTRAGDGAKLVVVRYEEDGVTFLRLRVIAADSSSIATSEPEPDINESHPCPPWPPEVCGGGG